MATERFLAAFDLHWGYEQGGGGKRKPLHDRKALEAVLAFMGDFKPQHVILGGDMLDCGPISHHNHGKPGRTEGLKLQRDAEELRTTLIANITAPHKTYIIGNHEDWIRQFVEDNPAIEGIVTLERLLGLDGWMVVPQGGYHRLGKLYFLHGDTISGGEHVAKAAVVEQERSVRFGHHHTFQAYTKKAPQDLNGHTGIAVPCLCNKGPGYGKGRANRWIKGFLWGYVDSQTGLFTDYVTTIINGRFVANGKEYRG